MKSHEAKAHLAKHGWTQRQAATELRVNLSYLNQVLGGRMESKRLLEAVSKLQKNPNDRDRPIYVPA